MRAAGCRPSRPGRRASLAAGAAVRVVGLGSRRRCRHRGVRWAADRRRRRRRLNRAGRWACRAAGPAVLRVALEGRAGRGLARAAHRAARAACGRAASIRADSSGSADLTAAATVLVVSQGVGAGASTYGLACRTGRGADSFNAELARGTGVPAASTVEGIVVETGAEGAGAVVAGLGAAATARLAAPARAGHSRWTDRAAGAAVVVVGGEGAAGSLQSFSPLLQVIAQRPRLQSSLAGQTVPQAPQFAGSFSRLAQMAVAPVPQIVRPEPQRRRGPAEQR